MTEPSRVLHEKVDRRLGSRGRADSSDRRGTERYASGFPVRVHLKSEGEVSVYDAFARDVSEGGLLLETVHIPGGVRCGTWIKLEFTVPGGTMPEEFIHGKLELEGSVQWRDRESGVAGVRFDKTMGEQLRRSVWPLRQGFGILGLIFGVTFILLLKYENFYFFWFDAPVFLYSLTVGAYLISRFLFAAFYRRPETRQYLPSVTIVIPAYNEEEHIERTLRQAMEVAYPQESLQVIVVNDGSDDRTMEVINRMRELYPKLVAVELGENRGKREALSVGARMATGEIVCFVDSDSFLRPDSIRNLVNGFADPEVAAVCGHCDVENQWDNTLTKMQAVRYFVSFRVMKAAESTFDSVTCLSGPLAAYRRTALMEVLEDWLCQTFLGQKATYGDDRSLTNYFLKDCKVIYDSGARVTTIVPVTYRQFFHQQLRWKRSWLRESIRASAYMWRKPPFMSLSFYLGLLLPMLGPAIVFRALIYVPLLQRASPFMYLFGIFLMSTLFSSTYLFARRSRLWWYGIPFCFFYMCVLVWQLPWAMATFWTSDWGTREQLLATENVLRRPRTR